MNLISSKTTPKMAQKVFVVTCSCLLLSWFWFGMIEFFPRTILFSSPNQKLASSNIFLEGNALEQIQKFRQERIPQQENTLPENNKDNQVANMQIRPALGRDMVHSLNEVSRQYKGSTASFYEQFYSAAKKDHCIDSDGGVNYALKGTVTWKKDKDLSLSFTDRILGEKDLLEFYCENGQLRAHSMTCPVKLIGATCIRSTQEAQSTEQFFSSAEKEFSTTQIIRLKRGWNWLSLSINPYSTLVTDLFEPLYTEDQEFIIKNEKGDLYWPKMEINTLEELDFTKPYQIYVSRPLEIEIPGEDLVYPLHLNFEEGWNFMGYPHFKPAPIECVLHPLMKNGYLWAARDFEGNTLSFVNGQWEDEIGFFEPGKAYQLYLQNIPEETVKITFPNEWECEQ